MMAVGTVILLTFRITATCSNTGDAVGGIFHPADGRRRGEGEKKECRIIQKYKQTYITVLWNRKWRIMLGTLIGAKPFCG